MDVLVNPSQHRRVLALAALVSCCATTGVARGQVPDAERPWVFTARSVHHGEAVPLRALDDEDEALARLDPRSGRNIAYVDDEVRLSMPAGAWTFSVLARSSALLVTDATTLDLVRQVSSDTTPGNDRRWSAQVRYESFQGAGVEAGYRFTPAERWQAGVAVQWLKLRHFRRRTLDGQVQFDAASRTYAFDLESTHADDRLRFPFQGPTQDGGMGLLFSADVGWRDDTWAASLGVRDVGWLRWNDLPHQYATLSTHTQSYDADGFVVYEPLVVGRNEQRRHTRTMPGWWTARASWRAADAGEFELSDDWVRDYGWLPAVAWQRRFGDIDLGVQWRLHERRVGVAVGWRGWQLRLGADRIGSQQRSREFSIGGSWRF